MAKNDLLNSKNICKKCKLNLFKRSSTEYKLSVSRKDLLLNLKQIKLESKIFPIFKNLPQLEDFLKNHHMNLLPKAPPLDLPDILQDQNLDQTFEPLVHLKRIILKILFGLQITAEEIRGLKWFEQDIVLLFIKKKRLFGFGEATIDPDFLENLRLNPSRKSTEENLKFVFKKCFRFLKLNYRKRIHEKLVNFLSEPYSRLGSGSHFEYAFSGVYFGLIANKLGQPIEMFFQPSFQRRFEILNPHDCPKTITKSYLGLVKQSPRFVSHMLYFLRNLMLPEAYEQVYEKTSRMVDKWEALVAEEGVEFLLDDLRSKFINNSKSKVPWTISEVQFAINQAIEFVSRKDKTN